MAAFVRSTGTTVTQTSAAPVFTIGASGVALGDTHVIVCVCVGANGPTSVTDSKGNTYSKVDPGDGTANIWVELWASVLGAALVSADTVTVNYSSSRASSRGGLEFSGVPSIALDVSNEGHTAGTDVPPPAAITTHIANDVVIFVTAVSVSATLDVVTPTNYTAGCSKPSSIPSFYASYSIVVAANTARTGGTAQWTASTGDVASVNDAMATQSAGRPPVGYYFTATHPGPRYG